MNLFRHKSDSDSYQTAGELGHSQYGTPIKQILHANPNSRAPKWIIIPTEWGLRANCGNAEEWAQDWAPDLWGAWVEANPGALDPGPEAETQTALWLRGFGEKFGGFDPSQPFTIVTYLYLPNPGQLPIAARVWVDDRPGLTPDEAAGVDDPDAIEKPTVEQFTTESLGPGLKVTRHGKLGEGHENQAGTGIFVAVRYAFAVPGRQAVVTVSATDTDLARMAAAGPDIDEFVRTITLVLADGTPFVAATADS